MGGKGEKGTLLKVTEKANEDSEDTVQGLGSQGQRPLNTTSDVPNRFAAEYIGHKPDKRK